MPSPEIVSVTIDNLIKDGNTRKVFKGSATLEEAASPTPCVIKTFDDIGELANECQNYLLCKAAGLPVPDFCFQYQNSLIFPDLTADNQSVVISTNSLSHCFAHPLSPVSARLDESELFNQNPKTNVDFGNINFLELELRIKELIAKAAQSKLILHCDSYFFVVSDEGVNKVLIGDFGNIKTTDQMPVPDLLRDQLTPEQWCTIRSSLFAEDMIEALSNFIGSKHAQTPPRIS